MAQDLINNDLHVNGALSCKEFNAPPGSITNEDIQAAAGISATKVVHQFPLRHQQAPTSTVVGVTELLHVMRSAGEVVSIEAVTTTPATGVDRTVTIDLQMGNASTAFASILTAPLVLDNSSVARTIEAGAIASPDLADGDQLQLVVTVAGVAGAQAMGLCVVVTLRENPQ